MRAVIVEKAGPWLSIQDPGRSGQTGIGLSRGGAADRRGYLEGLALLDQPLGQAVVECAGLGGAFRFTARTRFSLSGAGMRANLAGARVESHASHVAEAGEVLSVEAIENGVYGYVAFAGGIATEPEFGGRGFHKIGGFGTHLQSGASLPLGPDQHLDAPPAVCDLPSENGAIRVMPGPQTNLFQDATRRSFEDQTFKRSNRANRQGVGLDMDGIPFSTGAQLNQVSDFITEGDIQMTGDGTPYVLLADCQTIGGYPRIGTVLPGDLHRVAQAPLGAKLDFRFVSLEEAEGLWMSDQARLDALKSMCRPRVRNPKEMADLLSYELVDRPPGEVNER